METSASFEARSAPSSYPTAAGNGGHSQGDPNSADRLFPYSAGILGGTMETSASFEARYAPSSYPTIIVLGEAHLRRILKFYARYYNETRTHLALDRDAPVSRPVQRIGVVSSLGILGGLHHHYARA